MNDDNEQFESPLTDNQVSADIQAEDTSSKTNEPTMGEVPNISEFQSNSYFGEGEQPNQYQSTYVYQGQPVKQKKGPIIFICSIAAVALVLILLILFRMDIMWQFSTKEYVIKSFQNYLESVEKNNNYPFKTDDITSTELNISVDSIKVNGLSFLSDDYVFGFDISYISDPSEKKTQGDISIQLGGSDTIDLSYYADNNKYYAAAPALLTDTYLFEAEELNAEDESEVSEDVSDLTDSFYEEFKTILKNSKVVNDGKIVLDADDSVELHKIVVTVNGDDITDFVHNIPEILESSETFMTGFNSGLAQQDTLIDSDDVMTELKTLFETYECTEDQVTCIIGVTKDHKLAKIEIVSPDDEDERLVTFESYFGKNSNYIHSISAQIDGIGVDFLIKGSSESSKSVYTSTIDEMKLGIIVDDSGIDIGIGISGKSETTKLSSSDINYDTSGAIDVMSLENADYTEILMEALGNLATLNFLPDEYMEYISSYLEMMLMSDETDSTVISEGYDISESVSVSDSISYRTVSLEEDFLIFIKNESDTVIPYVEFTVNFMDEDGSMLTEDVAYAMMIPAGGEAVVVMWAPYDSNYDPIPYASTDITLVNDDDYSAYIAKNYESLAEQLQIESNIGGNGVKAEFTNNSDKMIDTLEGTIVYYRNGKVVGYDSIFNYDIAAGDSITEELYGPTDINYNNVEFDDYVIYINECTTELN